MPSAAEGASAKQNMAAALEGGVETLSLDQEIVFTKYIRLVLPLDGYVFWVQADLISTSALMNTFQLNEATLNEAQVIADPAPTMIIKGSLHYSTNVNQAESETEAVNQVIFTALSPIQKFNDIEPSVLWIGEYRGDKQGYDGPIEFAFSARGRYYEQADLYHYVGTAVLPVFKAQLITGLDQIYNHALIVSNSLPIWLSLQQYTPPYPGFHSYLPLFPSFLVPDNLLPPYGAIHIEDGKTESHQAAPYYDPTLGQHSLSSDMVRVTLYGCTNEAALTWLSTALQYSFDYNTIGIMNMPVIRDPKRVSAELGVIAQKKIIDFEVSYNQTTARNVARQYIEKVVIDYRPQPLKATGFQPIIF